MNDLRSEYRAALEEAKHSPKCLLPRIVEAEGIKLDGKGLAAVCPWCTKKKTFNVNNKTGAWLCGCFNDTCEAHRVGDVIGFLSLRQGISRKAACSALLEMAGIENPFDRARREKKHSKPQTESPMPEEAPSTQEPSSAPVFMKIPSSPNAYEMAWGLLELTQDHRMELRSKRGMPDAWIESLGYKSAKPDNARLLAPILSKFPPNELLRSGLAQRDPRDRSLRIADVICGRFFNEETSQWETSEVPIIPYVNEDGRITMLRPHKRSLSNKRWRERESMSADYEKLHHNLRVMYGQHLLACGGDEWPHTAVICEGEFKSSALAMCGIPSVAFQGIHFFRQGIEARQAITDTTKALRKLGIREVIVVFDNEDKGHKEMHLRFEAEIYARYTAECFEDSGFKAYTGMLPDEWREDGKADWDSRLAYHVKRSRNANDGIRKASAEFSKFLNDRSRKGARINPVQRQVDYLDAKEDIINQALHRLRHVPKIFQGGKRELDLASEIQNWCHPDYEHKLQVRKLCEALRDTVGGYYRPKITSDKLQETCYSVLSEIKKKITEAEAADTKGQEGEDEIRRLRAAAKAAETILYRFPKSFTDFTATSKYKVLVTETDGSIRHDRLINFRDRNGVRSRAFQMSSKLMRSAQELRSFFISMGCYHWFGGQEECDMWGQELDVMNYQKTIEEIDTYGWNKDGKFYLLGDCAVLDGGRFVFPDRNGIIWVNGTGFKNSDNMACFTSRPPILFPDAKSPKEAYEAIDWEVERKEVAVIWSEMLADYYETMGGYAGYCWVAGIIQYLSHPEVRKEIGGKPGLWVQGEKGSGKTKTTEFCMRALGFPMNYGYISLGGTKIGVERSLCQFSNLPFHIDEWRNENADPKLEDLLRNCYNETATPKGTPNGNKGVRKLIPSTIPIVTGEDGTSDSALRSRYVRIIASQSYGKSRSDDGEDQTVGDQQKRDARYYRIMERSEQYHRIGRFLFKNRTQFSELTINLTKQFCATSSVMERIKDSRARQVHGVFLGALFAAQSLLFDNQVFGQPINSGVMNWFVSHGAESAEETERDVFRRLFFHETVTMIDRGVQGINKLIRVRRGQLDSDGRLGLYDAINAPEGRFYVLIRASELFAEYKADKRKRGENAPIAQHNILAELRTQPAWVPAPRNDKTRQHRFSIAGEKNSKAVWWVLDYSRLDSELKNIFSRVLESEMNEVGASMEDQDELPNF